MIKRLFITYVTHIYGLILSAMTVIPKTKAPERLEIYKKTCEK